MRDRLSARTATAVAIAILVSCGGGAGGGEADEGGDGTSDIVTTGGYDPPPSDFDRPPGQDPPPSDYDDPFGRGCAQFCQALVAKGCTEFVPTSEACSLACAQDVVTEVCISEAFALLTCLINAPEFSCDFLVDDDDENQEEPQGTFEECVSQASAYDRCLGDRGGEGGQGGM